MLSLLRVFETLQLFCTQSEHPQHLIANQWHTLEILELMLQEPTHPK